MHFRPYAKHRKIKVLQNKQIIYRTIYSEKHWTIGSIQQGPGAVAMRVKKQGM